MTTVSVVIPTYNRADVLSRAIESVLNQTYGDWELLIIDNGSTDNTQAIVEQYNDDRIIYKRYEEQMGASEARNIGVTESSGQYISLLDSDDEYHQLYLNRIIDEFERVDPKCAFLFTSLREVRENGYQATVDIDDEIISYKDILSSNVVGGISGTTFRKSIISNYDLDDSLSVSEDYDLFIRILKDGHTAKGLSDVLLNVYKDSDDRLSDNLEAKIEALERLLEKHGGAMPPSGKSYNYYQLGIRYAQNNNFENARKNFLNAINSDKSNVLAYPHFVATINPQIYGSLIKIKRFAKKYV